MFESTSESHKKSKRWPLVTLGALLIVALGASAFFFLKYVEASKDPKADQKKTLESIASVIALPNEEPTSFNIADKSKLSNQALAGRVENGDTLFVYAQAKKLIIYRPSTKKVVDLLRIDSSAQVTPPAEATAPAPTASTKR